MENNKELIGLEIWTDGKSQATEKLLTMQHWESLKPSVNETKKRIHWVRIDLEVKKTDEKGIALQYDEENISVLETAVVTAVAVIKWE